MKAIFWGGVIFSIYFAFAYYVLESRRPTPAKSAVSAPFRISQRLDKPKPLTPVQLVPPLSASDAYVTDELVRLFGKKNLTASLNMDNVIRRFVATVVHLPNSYASERTMPTKSIPGSFTIMESDNGLVIDPANYRRYENYVDLLRAVGVPALARLYVRMYPLCQHAYRELGYQKGQFNDRFIHAINDLLRAPEIPGRIAVVRQDMLYRFSDPKLEALSVGQKMMIRMGLGNEMRLKSALRGIRTEMLLYANTI